MRKFILSLALMGGLASTASAQGMPWTSEIGLRSVFGQVDVDGTNVTLFDLPAGGGFSGFGGNAGLYAVFPVGSGRLAIEPSLGFSDDGPNVYNVDLDAYVPRDPGRTRTWKDIDDATLPVCGPADDPALSPGCAILDNGPRPGPLDPPAPWGVNCCCTLRPRP